MSASRVEQSGVIRKDLLILGLLILFPLTFILMATWLGKQNRHTYRLPDREPRSVEEELAASALGTMRVRSPLLVRWIEQGPVESRGTTIESRGDPMEQALFALFDQRPEDAVRLLSVMPDLEDHAGERALLLGIAQARSGSLRQAEAQFEKAAELLPDDPDPWYCLGNLLLSQNRAREAFEAATRAADVEDNHPDVQMLIGRSLAAQGDIGRAKRAFHNVLQYRPTDPYALSEVKRLDGSR